MSTCAVVQRGLGRCQSAKMSTSALSWRLIDTSLIEDGCSACDLKHLSLAHMSFIMHEAFPAKAFPSASRQCFGRPDIDSLCGLSKKQKGSCTYQGVLHLKAACRSALWEVQGPCDDVHILAGARQHLHKALKACPVVPAQHSCICRVCSKLQASMLCLHQCSCQIG